MKSSFTFLRVRGIPIGAHWSWLFVFALVTWSLGSNLFPHAYPGLSQSTYVSMGLAASVLFFVTILLHELGHAFRALREGMVIDGITLWLFGGVARFKGRFPSAGAEFRIAVAGPIVSFVVAGLLGAFSAGADAIGVDESVVGVTSYLWRINAIVAIFNLIPALPLDGGRILRSYLWQRRRDFMSATVSSARAGKFFGGALVAIGLVDFFTGGGGGGGLWFVFLGWFLIQAAEAESTSAVVDQLLTGRKVEDFMTRDPVTLSPQDTVAHLLDEVARTDAHALYPVLDDGRLVGLMSLKTATSIASDRRASTPVGTLMLGSDRFTIVAPETDMGHALQTMDEGLRRAPVVEDGRLVGMLSASDAARALETEPASDETARRPAIAAWLVVGVALILALGLLYRPPYAVVGPGPTLDVAEGISISGVSSDPVNGRYLLTSVTLDQPNALGLLLASVGSDNEILPLDEVIPEGVDQDAFFEQQREIFRQSEMVAAAAAASAAGLEVTMTGEGALVERVIESSPADEFLDAGDVIVSVDDRPVRVLTDLQAIVRSRPAGSEFDVVVERGGRELSFAIESARLSGVAEGSTGIGVIVSTADFSLDLPFNVDFEEKRIGGPSAGLAYALAIYDMLQPEDVAAGRTIAATGTIDLDGRVGEIGGVDSKAANLDDEGADVFLVPESQVDEVTEGDLVIEGVEDLEVAIEILRSGSA